MPSLSDGNLDMSGYPGSKLGSPQRWIEDLRAYQDRLECGVWGSGLLCFSWSGWRGSGALPGLTARAVETGQWQYFSRTASDKLGQLQYFLSKLGYPPAAAATRGHWAAGWPRNGHLLVRLHLEFQPLIPGHWQKTGSLGGSELYNTKGNRAHSC